MRVILVSNAASGGRASATKLARLGGYLARAGSTSWQYRHVAWHPASDRHPAWLWTCSFRLWVIVSSRGPFAQRVA